MPDSKKPIVDRAPDKVTTIELYGTTYTVEEYFDGKKSLEDIIVQRILQDQKRDIIYPSISNPING